ncbi:hypothetical protein EPN15_03930 [Patescibacteria group bacterium]|nr:MAG: hypothetical protein EPN15_03930 [Patescibacteria group bacterium]
MNLKAKIAAFCLFFLLFSQSASAAFDFGNIISDRDMQDSQSISVATIDRFLNSRNGILGKLVFDAVNGVGTISKKVSELIHAAGQANKINPKVLIVTLQKEQSLIEDPSPSQGQLDWAMGYAVCDDCSKSDPAIQKYKGFVNQINSAAARLRYYFDNPGQFRHQAGQTHTIDGVSVVMKNKATANLYNYTPHIHGNQNFSKFWNQWFVKNYPDGTLLQVDGQAGIWLIENGKRRPFLNKSAFLSNYDSDKVIKTTTTDLEKYSIGAPIKYSNYSLIKMPSGGIYLLIDNVKHPIASRDVFRNLGFNPEELIDGDEDDVKWYPKGSPITLEKAYPQGALLRDPETKGVWYVENGIKSPIWSKDIMMSRFSGRPVMQSSIEELELYEKGAPVKFRDGEIIATKDPESLNRSVYVVSNGQKRPIANREAFNALGYKWKNIIWTTDKVLDLHETGEMIDIIQ